MDYNLTAELDSTGTDDEAINRIMDGLRGYSPAIGWLDNGQMDVTITLEATGLAAAAAQGIRAIQDAAGVEVVHVEAMSTAEFDARQMLAS